MAKDAQENIAFTAMYMSTGLDAATCGEMLGVSRGYVYNVVNGSYKPSPGALNGVSVLCQDIQRFADEMMPYFREIPEGQSMTIIIRDDVQMVVAGRFLAMLIPEERTRVNLIVQK